MNEKDMLVVEAMERYGGSFVKALAGCARRADHVNLKKIKDTWSNYWKEYSEEVCEFCGGTGIEITDEDDGEGHIQHGVGSRKCVCQSKEEDDESLQD